MDLCETAIKRVSQIGNKFEEFKLYFKVYWLYVCNIYITFVNILCIKRGCMLFWEIILMISLCNTQLVYWLCVCNIYIIFVNILCIKGDYLSFHMQVKQHWTTLWYLDGWLILWNYDYMKTH